MYAVIMAGGRGSRFWPLSREATPKHLLNITGKQSIIQETIKRITPIIPEENIFIITSEAHYDDLKKQCSTVPVENIIAEPMGRNTAPCIGLAALYVKRRDPEGVMVVLPADHLITGEDRFIQTLAAADKMARRGNYLITVGIRPSGPETGYGYIEEGEPLTSIDGHAIYKVGSFREKPNLEEAMNFIKDGRFFWNSGMFIWKASTILEAIRIFLPDLYTGLGNIEISIGTEGERAGIKTVYETLEPISIDYGVMEKVEGTILIKGHFGWNDIGSWNALYDVFEKDDKRNAVMGRVIAIDSTNSIVYSPDKLVALVGVENLIVVETEDSLLICSRDASQNVKKVVDRLEKEDMKELL